MRLIFTSTAIAVKKALISLLALLLCILPIAGIAAAAVSSSPDAMKAIEIAVISEDNEPMAVSLIDSVVNTRFKGLAQIKLCENEQQAKGCAAVLTLPNDFWQSLMTGENLSPTLVIKAASPFEGLWLRQLANSAARLLNRAQNAMGALYAAMRADGLSDDEINRAIFACDMAMVNDYLTRKGRFDSVEISATGSLGAAEYYLCSAAAFVIFSLLFIFYSPIADIKSFGRFSLSQKRCFISAAISSLILCTVLIFAALAILGVDSAQIFSLKTAFAVVFCSALLLFSVTFMPNMPACAAFCFGITLTSALFGGGFIPEALLPEAFSPLYALLPFSLMRRLFADIAFSAGFENTLSVVLWCSLLITFSAFGWLREGAAK
ncbi:MAG: hypothetical protein J6C75_04010 [Oscillospiraceae bacterium]|nr:hypothetical protein [Oscillospiraceae bacterium]